MRELALRATDGSTLILNRFVPSGDPYWGIGFYCNLVYIATTDDSWTSYNAKIILEYVKIAS